VAGLTDDLKDIRGHLRTLNLSGHFPTIRDRLMAVEKRPDFRDIAAPDGVTHGG
jgi:hypothetical protein